MIIWQTDVVLINYNYIYLKQVAVYTVLYSFIDFFTISFAGLSNFKSLVKSQSSVSGENFSPSEIVQLLFKLFYF